MLNRRSFFQRVLAFFAITPAIPRISWGALIKAPTPRTLPITDVTHLKVDGTEIPRDYYTITWPLRRRERVFQYDPCPERTPCQESRTERLYILDGHAVLATCRDNAVYELEAAQTELWAHWDTFQNLFLNPRAARQLQIDEAIRRSSYQQYVEHCLKTVDTNKARGDEFRFPINVPGATQALRDCWDEDDQF